MAHSVAKAQRAAVEPNGWERWTWAALAIALVLVLSRATIEESLRSPFEVMPGSAAMVRTPGPATSLGLDLLCCLPALMVLLRRILDKDYALRHSWGLLLLAALSFWMVLSTAWSPDKFAAMVTAFHWLSAATLLWAAAQLVRDWMRLRIVAAACLGLLCIFIVKGADYRFGDLPSLRHQWEENKTQMLQERGYTPGSFQEEQLGNYIKHGELIGFSASPNSFAALLVLLALIATGLLIQRAMDGVRVGALIAAILIVLGLVAAALTLSKTMAFTSMLGAVLFCTIALAPRWLAAHARCAYFTGVGVVLLGIAAVVGVALVHGNLISLSLTFRWHYWVGAARIMRSSPLLAVFGTGWSNFGLYYLQYRLPQAPEEVRDPHCFIVRFFVELGLIGGILALAWMLRLWWELSISLSPVRGGEGRGEGFAQKNSNLLKHGHSPHGPSPQPSPLRTGEREKQAMPLLAVVAILFVLLTLAISPDWSQNGSYLLIEVWMRLIYGIALLIPATLATVRSLREPVCDDRPAPWVLWGILVGLAMLLVHNLIDFSFFEIGPTFLFALLAGSALGVRQADSARRRAGAGWALTGSIVLWLAAVFAVWVPTITAEQSAAAGDEALRTKHYGDAFHFFSEAAEQQPLNADYRFRAAVPAMYVSTEQARQWLAAAIAADPRQVRYYLDRAGYETGLHSPDIEQIIADYRIAVSLNPNGVEGHLQFAAALQKLGRPTDRAEARQQYQQALEANDHLPAKEVRRLPPERIEDIQRKIRELGG